MTGLSNNSYACDQTSIVINNAIDNGDGTYTYTVTICLGISPNWGASGDLTITVGGANIISSSTSSVSTTYTYCDEPLLFNGQGCQVNSMGQPPVGGNLITTTATGSVGVMNGDLVISNSGDPLAPGDINGPSGDCADCGNGNQVCFQVTFTTDAPITNAQLNGAEDQGSDCGNPTCCPNEIDTTVPPLQPGGCTPPTASFSSNSPQCVGSTFNFTNTGSSGGGNYTYAWTFAMGTPSTSTSENPSGISWSSTGDFDVELVVCLSSDNTCCATVLQSITLNPNPTVTLTGVDETCAGVCDGSATSNVTGGTPNYNYVWSSGPTTSAVSGICDGSYALTVTDQNGCTGDATVVIAAGPSPTSGFTVSGSGCVSSNNFSFTNIGSSGGGVSIAWDFGDGSGTSTANNPSYSYATCGTFTVTQTITEGGCDAVSTQDITVLCEPVLAVVPTDESCAGACDGALNLTPSGGLSPYTYSWSNGPTTQDQTGLCSGNYTVTVTGNNGCTAVITGTVAAGGATPTAGFTYNGNQCLTGNSYDFVNTGTTAAGGATFDWDFGDGMGSSTAEDPSYTYTSTGTYTVTQIVILAGCSATASIIIVVNPDPSAAIIGVDESCPGACDGTADLTPSGGTPGYTYSWGGGETSQDLSGLCAGTYDVTVTDVMM